MATWLGGEDSREYGAETRVTRVLGPRSSAGRPSPNWSGTGWIALGFGVHAVDLVAAKAGFDRLG